MEQGIRIRTIILLCLIVAMLTPQFLTAQLNPVNNLEWEHWYISPDNYFDLSWEQPDSTMDTLVGYNVYRETELYRFQTETSLTHTPAYSNCGEDFVAYNAGPFWMHVTAVYNTTLQESGYIDSAFCYGYAIGIIEYVNQVYKSYPNPFTNSTTIKFALDGNSNIEFSIFNSIGEMVHKFEETYDQGTHQVTWSPHHMPAGLYYAVLRSEDGVSVVKMVKQ